MSTLRKYCVVPMCPNTTTNAPEKLFFYVPRETKTRKKWMQIIKRTVTPLSGAYCCEDHFNVEEDMDSYLKFKMMGGNLRLKKGVLPHKFACQNRRVDKITEERPAYKKRRQIEFMEKVLSPNICHENLITPNVEFAVCEIETKEEVEKDPFEETAEKLDGPKFKSIGIQVNIKPKNRSRSTNTDVEMCTCKCMCKGKPRRTKMGRPPKRKVISTSSD